ncbi:MAG: prepilin-type N-terminal cleavage/methylation domain-containing protein [Patescibacteria group bacterium]|nr:prepilin-type N-terminal cleavage/methylation domain-containing protein [Patescibacteria group bacterium]
MTGAKKQHGIRERQKHGHKAHAFTLFEMLLAVFIFSMVAVILVQIFVSFTRLQRKVANAALLSQDMRYLTEMMTRAARSNYIDYSVQPYAGKSNFLKLVRPTGGTLLISKQDSTQCGDPTITSCIMLSEDDGLSWQVATSKRVNVQNFDVHIRPSNTPFIPNASGAYDNNSQPFVTFNIGLEYKPENLKEGVTLRAQSTVSSRLYQR